ncbi:beta-carotene 15,15'-monooxygenase [Haladaptatus sp. W1]|uniref:carotenoid oxygenase family protein n=1 Tax=Haladaptatus sp. W1 TaxID=1897478 RepID=UPI000849CFAF|nr:carotenoid oxygenase family protein [Haladaptatus sp. W1]ODR80543.1 beta-carotene 15,15'-monooxygenase [Haladaptatus sp. W1]
MENTWRAGFRTQCEELHDVALDVEGTLPGWLDGEFISNGPGQFEVGETPLKHWFDALAMLRGFRIDDGSVRYTNRFVRSDDFRVARERQRVRRSLPGTPADGSAFKRLYHALSGAFQDNPSIGVIRLDDTLYAVTESPVGFETDPETLETTGQRDLTTGVNSDITLGHAHVEDGVQWGLAADFGNECTYTLFRRTGDRDATPISRLVFDDHPPYIHAFAMTEHYAVIPEAPYGVDFRRLLLGTPRGTTFLDAFEPREAPPRFHVFDRATGERVAAVRTEPFFIYHFANAYEDDDTIIVDCVAYPDLEAITGLTLSNLRRDDPNLPRGNFVRYRLPLRDGDVRRTLLLRGPVEFPTIHYGRYNACRYRYAYLAAADYGALPTAIAKVDLDGPTTVRWSEPGLHPGEPIFVPAPLPTTEDDGVLLSVALNGRTEQSVLLCLDAETVTERARAPLPHRLPYGFHGQFYGATDLGRSMA